MLFGAGCGGSSPVEDTWEDSNGDSTDGFDDIADMPDSEIPPSGCFKVGPDIRVSNSPATYSLNPSMVWNGSEYAVAWQEDTHGGNDEIYFRRISEDGTPHDTEMRVTDAPSVSENPSLVWNGNEYGVAWRDDRDAVRDPTEPLVLAHEIYFKRISDLGVPLGADVRITNELFISHPPSLEWTGTEYGLSWSDDNYAGTVSDLNFRQISESGELIGSVVRVGAGGESSLVWAESGYGMSWTYAGEMYFGKMSPSGSITGVVTRITDSPSLSNDGSLVWTGSEYGMSWVDYRDDGTNSEIYFARLSDSGALLAAEIRLTETSPVYLENAYGPSIVWTGSEYAISWDDNHDGGTWNNEIYFGRISESGTLVGPNLRVTNNEFSSKTPSLVWTGRGYGISWSDDRDGEGDIYFAQIICTP